MDTIELIEPFTDGATAATNSFGEIDQYIDDGFSKTASLNASANAVYVTLEVLFVKLQSHIRERESNDRRLIDVATTTIPLVRLMLQKMSVVKNELSVSMPEQVAKGDVHRKRHRLFGFDLVKRKQTGNKLENTRAWMAQRQTLVLLLGLMLAMLQGYEQNQA